jgi:hypothetical protein
MFVSKCCLGVRNRQQRIPFFDLSMNVGEFEVYCGIPYFIVCLMSTVGAQSIARLGQNCANSLNSISGHRCPRDLWFFCLKDLR